MVLLTQEPIDRTRLLAGLSSPETGALVVFEGSVRNYSCGRAVTGLYYEAYPELAQREMGRIEEEARRRWRLGPVVIAHRVGALAPGETSVLIATASSHRAEGFDACRFVIDSLKARVPIWKKECYEDGSAWIGEHP
jgi:molybdopterin synthase catalytic subunit